MYLADTHNCAYLTDDSNKMLNDNRYEPETINIAQDIPIADAHLRDIQRETAKDETPQALQEVILAGWPSKFSSTPLTIRPYFHVHDELVIQNGIVFKGECAVIPLTLCADIKEPIHSSQIGTEGCL